MKLISKLLIALSIIAAIIIGYFVWATYFVKPVPIEEKLPVVINQPGFKIFQGNGFTFKYPDSYTADEKGLWKNERFQDHLNPPAECDTCQIADIFVESVQSNQTIEQKLRADFDLGQTTFEQAHIELEKVFIGGKEFTKVKSANQYNEIDYLIKKDDLIVAFKVYWADKDNADLKGVLESLTFTR